MQAPSPSQQERIISFNDRTDAGRQLARLLHSYAQRPDVIVLALPRGGVPVAFEVARALGAPMDVFVVRKLGFPGHAEFAIGALASGGERVLDDGVIRRFGIPDDVVDDITASESAELKRREREYRGNRPAPQVAGRTVIIVDDGLATGSSMRAAIAALQRQGASKIVVAVPVAPADSCDALRQTGVEVVCAETPAHFDAVGAFYADFRQTTDDEVRQLLTRAAGGVSTTSPRSAH